MTKQRTPLPRRLFLSGAAGALCTLPWIPSRAQDEAPPVLVTVFLRGGMDSLNLIAPTADADYRRLRPDLALPSPPRRDSDSAGSIRLDRRFAVHPGLRPLMAHRDELAFVLAAGLPEVSRSHFTAQYLVEHGAASAAAVDESGWLARVHGELSTGPAVALDTSLPHSLSGSAGIALGTSRRNRRSESERLFARLYEEAADAPAALQPIVRAGERGLLMRERLRRLAPLDSDAASNFGRGGFARNLLYASRLIADTDVRLITVSHGSWDTHRGQSNAFAGKVRELSSGLAAFWESLGRHRSRVVVVVMSEFGRTAAQNGTAGTDHGWASAMMVLGERVRGGALGAWPGLARDELYEGRDLRVETDYRKVLASIAQTHLGVSPQAVQLPRASLRLFRS